MNESYLNNYQIKKGDDIGYLIIEPSDIKICYKKNRKSVKRQNVRLTIYPKTGQKNGKTTCKKIRQAAGFLNRYDFAYAGRDTVNQVVKIAPKIITQATSVINKIIKERIDQIVRSDGAEIERAAPKIIKGAIEEVYKTPFRLLGNLGKKDFQNIKRKLFK